MLPTLSSLFCMELWLANFLWKRQINLQRVVCKQRNWQWIFPQNVTFFSEYNFDRIFKKYPKWGITGKIYPWSCCCLFINLYPASRSPSIFLDKLGRLKRSIAWWDKTGTILEPRMNRVSKHENRVSSFEKPAFLYSPLERISGNDLFLEKHNNNHSHIHWMHGPMELASTIWAKLSLSFWVIKKDQQKVFIWKFGKLTQYFCIKSIFWTITTVFIYVKVCIYGHGTQQRKLKRDWNVILYSCCESLILKTGMCLRAALKFSQNVQQKIKKV